MDAKELLKEGVEAVRDTIRNLDGNCPLCGVTSDKGGEDVYEPCGVPWKHDIGCRLGDWLRGVGEGLG